jgi:hypothetical protein
LYFRCKEYPKAEECAKEALDMAKKYGFNTEIKPAEDRLEEIRGHHLQVTEEPRSHGYDDACTSETSEGQNGDISSCESDFMTTPSFN